MRHWATGSRDSSHNGLNEISIAAAVQESNVLNRGGVWMLKLSSTNFASFMKL